MPHRTPTPTCPTGTSSSCSSRGPSSCARAVTPPRRTLTCAPLRPLRTRPSSRYLKFLQFLGPLIVCVISIAIMNGADLYVVNPDDANTPLVKPVGLIPKGLPPVTTSWWFPL